MGEKFGSLAGEGSESYIASFNINNPWLSFPALQAGTGTAPVAGSG